MSGPVIVTNEMKLKPGLGEVIAGRAPAMIDETAQRPGFIGIHIQRHKDDPDHVLLVEKWASEEDFRNYIAWREERGEGSAGIVREPPTINVWPLTDLDRWA